MNEAVEKRVSNDPKSELDMPRWSLVSFDECEASGLTYAQAVALLEEKDAAAVYGLCIITDQAAAKITKRLTNQTPESPSQNFRSTPNTRMPPARLRS